jgi:hypothetical protein
MAVAMLEMLKDGPPEFAAVLQTHFRLKRTQIVEQCEEWLASAKDTEPQKAGGPYGYHHQTSDHHQLPLVTRASFSMMVGMVKSYLDTLEVADSITIV